MAEDWVECPNCHTGYRPGRLGITMEQTKQATIVCLVCKRAFDVDVVVNTTWEQKSRWNPLKAEVTTVTVTSKLRVA